MKRRGFVIATIATALARTFPARADEKAMLVVGILDGGSAPPPQFFAAVSAGLAEEGYVEGRDFRFERREANGQYDRLPALLAELISNGAAIIYTTSNPASQAAKAANAPVPIVFSTGDDPVATGLVASLSRPGGNLTGIAFVAGALPVKRLELLHETVQQAHTVGFLVNPNAANAKTDVPLVQAAAETLGLRLVIARAASDADLETAFSGMAEQRAEGLVVNTDAFLTSRRERIVALATTYKLPAIYPYREHVTAGGLMSYGGNFADMNRQVGIYVGRILHGAKPADLPVVLASKLDLFINLKTAKTLGLDIPPLILARADDVIE